MTIFPDSLRAIVKEASEFHGGRGISVAINRRAFFASSIATVAATALPAAPESRKTFLYLRNARHFNQAVQALFGVPPYASRVGILVAPEQESNLVNNIIRLSDRPVIVSLEFNEDHDLRVYVDLLVSPTGRYTAKFLANHSVADAAELMEGRHAGVLHPTNDGVRDWYRGDELIGLVEWFNKTKSRGRKSA